MYVYVCVCVLKTALEKLEKLMLELFYFQCNESLLNNTKFFKDS